MHTVFQVELKDGTVLHCILCKEDGNKKELSIAGSDRIQTIIESSKQRFDDLHEDLETRLLADKHLEALCYRDCASMYTSKSRIKRLLDKMRASKICSKTSASVRINNLRLQATLPFMR